MTLPLESVSTGLSIGSVGAQKAPAAQGASVSRVRPRSSVLGIPVDHVSRAVLHEEILGAARSGNRSIFLHANVHGIMLAQRDPFFRAAYQNVPIVFCDGAGVMLGARILGQEPPPERFGYAEWLWHLLDFGQASGLSFYFLGGKPGIADLAAERVRGRFPDLRVESAHGYFDHTYGSAESREAVERINRFRPSVLIVAFGMPRQERWLVEHWADLDVGVGLTGGACFDYLSGQLRRPPALLCDNGLEWLGRMVMQPRHLAGRYLRENPMFVLKCLRSRMDPAKRSKTNVENPDTDSLALSRRLMVPRAEPYA